MSEDKSAAERLLSTRSYCTGQPHPITNPMGYAFEAADVFAVARRCLELESNLSLLEAELRAKHSAKGGE